MKNEHAVVAHSSIALLQERFRELQRVKEMREERELLKLLSLSNPTNKKQQQLSLLGHLPVAVGTFFWHPELMMATRMTPQTTSLSLCRPMSQPGVEAPPLIDLWAPHHPADTIHINASDHSATSLITIDHDHDSESDSDVDTSLHL